MVFGPESDSPTSDPVLWTQDSRVDLAAGAPTGYYRPVAMNPAGTIATGTYWGESGELPFVWTKATGMRFLDTLPGGTWAHGISRNDGGVIAGDGDTASGAIHGLEFLPCSCGTQGAARPANSVSTARPVRPLSPSSISPTDLGDRSTLLSVRVLPPIVATRLTSTNRAEGDRGGTLTAAPLGDCSRDRGCF
jgi:hypothetical protein